jgi:uncharacterized protein YecT (DUF1311 family)
MRNGNSHGLAVLLFGILLLLPCSFGQQSQTQAPSAKPKKVLTPEQIALQQRAKETLARRLSLQAQAKQIFDAEMDREKAGDCPDAKTTADFNNCFEDEGTTTEKNLTGFEGIIRELNAPEPPLPGRPGAETTQPVMGISGPGFTPEQFLAEFDRVEKAWREYRQTACTAAFHQFDGGTGGPSFEGQCELKLARDHMRELDMIYGNDLHL